MNRETKAKLILAVLRGLAAILCALIGAFLVGAWVGLLLKVLNAGFKLGNGL